MQTRFSQDILRFNGMYRMQVSAVPTLRIGTKGPAQRLLDFKSVLAKELEEVNSVVAHIDALEKGMPKYLNEAGEPTSCDHINALSELADLLGDLIVYCGSEMAKFGLPLDRTLSIIMASNFSKLFDDGPHFDERDKLLKGPRYWKPEPQLRMMVEGLLKTPVDELTTLPEADFWAGEDDEGGETPTEAIKGMREEGEVVSLTPWAIVGPTIRFKVVRGGSDPKYPFVAIPADPL